MTPLQDIVAKFRKSSPNIALAFDEVERVGNQSDINTADALDALAKRLSVLEKPPVVTPPPPPVPVERWDLMDPRDPMLLTAKEGGLAPVQGSLGTWRCEAVSGTGLKISRVHWEVDVAPGEEFCLAATFDWTSGFRGTMLRLESYNDALADLHRLELDRFGDGKWYVVRNRLRPPAGSQAEHTPIAGPLDLPVICGVELSGRLGGKTPKTTLKVNGAVVVDQIGLPNWSDGQPHALRARFGIVEGSQSEPATIWVGDARFRKGTAA